MPPAPYYFGSTIGFAWMLKPLLAIPMLLGDFILWLGRGLANGLVEWLDS